MDAADRYCALSKSLVNASLALTRSSMMLIEAKNKRALGSSEDEAEEENSPLMLLSVATDGCLLARCLAGGGDFSEALTLAKTLVGMRGGPVKILQSVRSSKNAFLPPELIWTRLLGLQTSPPHGRP